MTTSDNHENFRFGLGFPRSMCLGLKLQKQVLYHSRRTSLFKLGNIEEVMYRKKKENKRYREALELT